MPYTSTILDQELDYTSDRPPYRQIADHLRQAITDDRITAGAKLPSETALVQHYGVARMTARHAVTDLRDEGLVEAEHGKGVFVRHRPHPGQTQTATEPAPHPGHRASPPTPHERTDSHPSPVGAFAHPDSEEILARRHQPTEQLSYASPRSLQIRARLRALNAAHGNPGIGTLAAALLDAGLRAHGYPPTPDD